MSIGLATYPDHAATAEDLIDSADKALYNAKAEGRNRLAIAEPLPS
jgi:diguanylate cyclase (GGDEF)-like protein